MSPTSLIHNPRRIRHIRRSATAAVAASLSAVLALSACSSDDSGSSESTSSEESSHDGHDHEDEPAAEAQEVDAAEPRILTTYDGGYLTLDANTLEVISDEKIDGFNRLNPLGDGRHVLLSTSDGFQLIDAGVWTEPHGDHTHSYAGDPVLTDTVFGTDTPGHVVSHDGNVALFGDGDGKIQLFKAEDFLDISGGDGDDVPEPTVKETDDPHHGVAVELSDGTLLHTEGTEEHRDTVVALSSDGEEIASSNDCEGVHGEATAAGEAVSFGCEDGVLVYKDGEFTKIDAEDSYGRTGNQSGSDESPVVLGDYKVDEDAELERPTRIKLTNTEDNTAQLVELGTSYSFRSLARGPEGEALVLGTDGKLHVIDPETGEKTDSWDVIDEWEEPVEWQEARPTLFVQGDRAYVSEPSSNELHVVDLSNGEILTSAELPETPNELTGVTG